GGESDGENHEGQRGDSANRHGGLLWPVILPQAALWRNPAGVCARCSNSVALVGRVLSSGGGSALGSVTRSPESQPYGLRAGRGGPPPPLAPPPPDATRPSLREIRRSPRPRRGRGPQFELSRSPRAGRRELRW